MKQQDVSQRDTRLPRRGRYPTGVPARPDENGFTVQHRLLQLKFRQTESSRAVTVRADLHRHIFDDVNNTWPHHSRQVNKEILLQGAGTPAYIVKELTHAKSS